MDYTPIIDAVIKAAAVGIVGLISYYAKRLWGAKEASEHVKGLYEFGRIAVNAAEQMGKTLGWDNVVKRENAIKWIIASAKDNLGLKIPEPQAQMIMEAALSELQNQFSRALLEKQQKEYIEAMKIDKIP